ncbi:MAG: hypothetical protein U0Q16_19260 [Bryobacteraceae bacterium]
MLKGFGDEAPRILLHLLGIVRLDSAVEIRPLRPETAPPAVFPDYVLVLAVETDEPFIFHVEFQYVYHDAVPESMARYGGSLAWQHQKRVVSVLVLIDRAHAPEHVPEYGEYRIFHTVTRHPFQTTRLWELDPAPVMDAGQIRLLPWAAMMKASDEQLQAIARAVRQQGDDETKARFLSAASFRYDRSQLEDLLGVSKMGFVEAFLEGSSLVREVRDEARQEGRAEGRTEGQIETARHFVRTALKSRFPGLERLPAIDAISDVETLENLVIHTIVPGADPAEVLRAVEAAARCGE